MNTESAAAIAEILIRLDARLDRLETLMMEMRDAKDATSNEQTPGRALQGWNRGTHHSRLGEI